MLQIEPGTNGNHAPIGQAQNDGSSANSQEIPVSMDNVRPEGTEDQYVTSPNGEALGRNFHVRRSERIRNSPQILDYTAVENFGCIQNASHGNSSPKIIHLDM